MSFITKSCSQTEQYIMWILWHKPNKIFYCNIFEHPFSGLTNVFFFLPIPFSLCHAAFTHKQFNICAKTLRRRHQFIVLTVWLLDGFYAAKGEAYNEIEDELLLLAFLLLASVSSIILIIVIKCFLLICFFLASKRTRNEWKKEKWRI